MNISTGFHLVPDAFVGPVVAVHFRDSDFFTIIILRLEGTFT